MKLSDKLFAECQQALYLTLFYKYIQQTLLNIERLTGEKRIPRARKLNFAYDPMRQECDIKKLTAWNLHLYSSGYKKECHKHAERYFRVTGSEWGVYFPTRALRSCVTKRKRQGCASTRNLQLAQPFRRISRKIFNDSHCRVLRVNAGCSEWLTACARQKMKYDFSEQSNFSISYSLEKFDAKSGLLVRVMSDKLQMKRWRNRLLQQGSALLQQSVSYWPINRTHVNWLYLFTRELLLSRIYKQRRVSVNCSYTT